MAIRLLITVTLILTFAYSHSQKKDLLKSRQSSGFRQIYELTEDQARIIYQENTQQFNPSFFTQLYATVPIDSAFAKELPTGHYLVVIADQNQLLTEMISVTDFTIDIGNNQSDLFIQLWRNGDQIRTAQIKLKGNRIRYNQNLQGYWKRKTNKSGLLEIKLDSKTWYYTLNKELKNSRFRRLTRKVVNGTPLRHIISPVIFTINLPVHGVKSITQGYTYGNIRRIKQFGIRTYQSVACLFDNYHCQNSKYGRLQGYALTNQPKYRKGDTVRFKALNLSRKGKPKGNKPLNVYLSESWGKYKLIEEISPYRKGAYHYDLVLHDSLNLKLDQNYRISIGADKNKIRKTAHFSVEDYELKSLRLNLRTSSQIVYKDSTFTIYVEGKDENDLTIPDGEIRLYALTRNIKKAYANNVFIPDTLWTYSGPLEPSGETEINLPDSVMPNADFSFKLLAELRNTENEYLKKDLTLNHQRTRDFGVKLNGDSIEFLYLVNGKSMPATGQLAFGSDTVDTSFPARHKLNQLIDGYSAFIQGKWHQANLESPGITVSTARGADSLIIDVNNPSKLNFTYFVYRVNNLIAKGFSSELYHKIKNPGNSKYYFHIQYAWGNEIFTEDYEITKKPKHIVLSTDLPTKAYPGMVTEVTVKAADEKGNPITDADITALGITKKFNYNPPTLYNLQKPDKKFRHLINRFTLEDVEKDSQQLLDYYFWKNRLGLDSIEYYHFLYPTSAYYEHHTTSRDSVSILSPFVVKDGAIQTVKVLYIDREPVYFAWNTLRDPYAFRIDPGYHSLKLRLDKALITVDSIWIEPGVKTILSIPHRNGKNILIEERKSELSSYEQKNLHRYILPYRRIDNSMGTFAYLRQNERYFQLAPNTNYYQNLTGPVNSKTSYLNVLDDYDIPVDIEANFEYDFSPKLMKMRAFKNYPKWLSLYAAHQSLFDMPLTYEDLREMKDRYQERLQTTSHAYYNPSRTLLGKSTLHIDPKKSFQHRHVLNTLLFKKDDAQFTRVYGGLSSKYHDLDSGFYKLVYLLSDRSYAVQDSLFVKQSGQHFYHLDTIDIHLRDRFSTAIDSLLKKISGQNQIYPQQKTRIQQTYREKYSYSGVGKYYTGVVSSMDDGSPLPGVNVVIKGTNYGTVTNLDGIYNLYAPHNSTLVFSFIGLTSEEVESGASNIIDVQMEADVTQLSEVVVVAYGTSTKRSLTASIASVSALEGRVAGVQITGAAGAGRNITLRGISSISGDKKPLFIVDGVPFEGELDEDAIINMELLKGEAATAIYGSQASNGVILITTKGFKKTKGIVEPEPTNLPNQNSIRSDFKDYSVWEPALKTNNDGEAKFKMKLPDDITNWETNFVAYGRGKRIGSLKVNTSSYLPLSGRLALPRFLIPGDSAVIIGKASNYTGLEQQISYSFYQDERTLYQNSGKVMNVLADSTTITVSHANDTTNITYSISSENGFSDGEQREIPVFEKGIKTVHGYFFALDRDTTVNISFPDSLGTIKLYATGDLKNVFKDEIDYLIDYKYGCNEQLASKLTALVTWAEIEGQMSKPHIRKADQIVKKLKSRQNSSGMWGWWSESYFESWVTEHIVKALKAYQPYSNEKFDFAPIVDNAIWEVNKVTSPRQKLALISILKATNPNQDLSTNMQEVEQKWKELTVLDKFTFWRLRQAEGVSISKDSIMKYSEFDSFGNLYFRSNDDIERAFHQGNTYITLKAYELLRALGEEKLARKIVNYFLRERSGLRWKNTYESARVISTLKSEIKPQKDLSGSLTFSGILNRTVSEFPISLELEKGGRLTIEKTGNAPIYFTAYQEIHLENPQPLKDHYSITTSFDSEDSLKLIAGEVVNMEVEIHSKAASEFLAVDIPIPASCSYGKKGRSYNETHREYYRDKVSIFFKKLRKGVYTTRIELIPRYSGSYTLNPVQAHWMYFPLVRGWNTSKRIQVSKTD